MQSNIPTSLLSNDKVPARLEGTVAEYLDRRVEESDRTQENISRAKMREYCALKSAIEHQNITPLIDWASTISHPHEDLGRFLKYIVGCKVQDLVASNRISDALDVCLRYSIIIGSPFDDSTYCRILMFSIHFDIIPSRRTIT